MRKQSWNSSRGCHSRSFLQPYIFQELLEHQVTPWIWWDGATSTPPMQSQQHLECLELELSIPFWGKREFSGELMPPPSSPLSREWRWHFPAGSTASAERLFPWKQSPSNLQRTQSSGKENSAIKAKAGLFLAKSRLFYWGWNPRKTHLSPLSEEEISVSTQTTNPRNCAEEKNRAGLWKGK